MSTFNIVFVRHGNTFNKYDTPCYIGTKTDLPLTQQGHAQGGRLAVQLSKKYHFGFIFSGQQKRHLQTARYFQALSGINITESACFSELDYGEWEGKTIETIQTKWPDAYHNWTRFNIWPSECFRGNKAHVVEQLQRWIAHIKKLKTNTDILVVTSQGILKLIYELIALQRPTHEQIDFTEHKVKTGHYCLFSITNDSLKIDAWDQSPKQYVSS